jgi:hypothetical protein
MGYIGENLAIAGGGDYGDNTIDVSTNYYISNDSNLRKIYIKRCKNNLNKND